MLIKSGLLTLSSPAPQRLPKVKAKLAPLDLGLAILQGLFTQGLGTARLWAHRKGHGQRTGGGPGLRAGMWAGSTVQTALLGTFLPGHREDHRAASAPSGFTLDLSEGPLGQNKPFELLLSSWPSLRSLMVPLCLGSSAAPSPPQPPTPHLLPITS